MVIHGFPRKVYWNDRAGDALASLLSEEGVRRLVVVTDKVIAGLEQFKELVETLGRGGFEYRVYDRVPPEPPLSVADEIAGLAREVGAEAIVAVGGGSVIDAAKSALVRILRPEVRLEDVAPFNPLGLDRGGVLLIAIPTTSGTGSDASHAMVLTRVEGGVREKVPMAHYDIIPYASILDPRLPGSAPRRLYTWTAMDALSHALEALASTGATPFSDALAERAAEIIITRLQSALEGDEEARAEIHAAATMAGMAFTNGGLGLAHAIAHPLGAALGTHHGATVGIVTPRVVRLNYGDERARAKYERLRSILEDVHGLPHEDDLAGHIYRLYERVGAPSRLRDLGVEEARLREVAGRVAEAALHDADIAYAPIIPPPEEIERLIRGLY